jgi:hypothetical protein
LINLGSGTQAPAKLKRESVKGEIKDEVEEPLASAVEIVKEEIKKEVAKVSLDEVLK